MKIKGLFILLIILSILSINVKANTCNPDKVSIESISTLDKTNNVEEIEEASKEGKNIKLNLSMSDVGDYIKYKLIIKNDSNEDYKLAEKSLNIESDYMNYSFELEDNSDIIKANSSKIIYLKVEYQKEIPSEELENDVFNEKKAIPLNILDNEITNPDTKRNIIILSIIVLIIISTILISIKNKKYLKPMILIIGIALPVITYALCDANIELDLQLKIVPSCVPFNDESSWEGIINSVKNNNTECMNVGDMKTIDMGTLGTHTVRIANKSTPSECSAEGFSETACGFVVEFADIITKHAMNSDRTGNTDGTGNKGGWEHCEMREYVNNDIYNLLPAELKEAILNTKVVSGGGYFDSENLITIDKLYLLATHEIWEDDDEDISSGLDSRDKGYNNTRQLDYYNELGVISSSSRLFTRKKYNESNTEWWTRSSDHYNNNNFYNENGSGYYPTNPSNHTFGVSPAFRIG